MTLREIIDILPRPLDDDGNHGKRPDQDTIDSAVKFFEELPLKYRLKFEPLQHLTPTAHGTLVFDFSFRKSFVSIEIGSGKIGIFCDLPDGSTPQLNASLDATTANIALSCLKTLYE